MTNEINRWFLAFSGLKKYLSKASPLVDPPILREILVFLIIFEFLPVFGGFNIVSAETHHNFTDFPKPCTVNLYSCNEKI